MDFAKVHPKPSRAHAFCLLKIVADPYEASLARFLTLPPIEKLLGSFGCCSVEGCRRLVQEQDRRIELERPDEGDNLGLTA